LNKWFSIIALIAFGIHLTGCNPAPRGREEANGNRTDSLPEQTEILLAAGTTLFDTGLMDTLITLFEGKHGYHVKPISVGSGAALEMARRGEIDVLIGHSPEQETLLMESGHIMNRTFIMLNDFVLAGPKNDPAGIAGLVKGADALSRIAGSKARFVSRGDNSGTHSKEMQLWEMAGITPNGSWYIESGTGMGQTLTVAAERQAYVLTDRGTFLVLKPRIDLKILLQGDPVLTNIYHVMQVNPATFPNVNYQGAKDFISFLLSEEAQGAIEVFGRDLLGESLFYNIHSPQAVAAGIQ